MKLILTLLIVIAGWTAQHVRSAEDATASQSPPELLSQLNNFTIGSELAKKFIEHFKSRDSMNLPLPIPDPLIMPDRVYPILGMKVSTINVTAYGVSRIRVENFTADAVEMKVHFGLRMPKLMVVGNYSFTDWFMKRFQGGFNVTVTYTYLDCYGALEITLDGELEATTINMDLTSHEKMKIEIQEAGFVGVLVNILGEPLFYAIKPYLLSLISNNIRGTLNTGLKRFTVMFPNSIAPLDLAIAKLRKYLKKEFDPYYVADYQYTSSIYSVDVTRIVINGLSSIYRAGDVKLLMNNRTVNVIANVETEELEGSCSWEAGIAGILTKSGVASFTVDYVNVMMSLNQSLDIRKKPKIVDFQIKLGNLQLRVDGAGSLDYVAELGVNVLPNLLRYQIMQAMEKPMRRKIQEALDDTDVEQVVLDKLPIMDQQLYNRSTSVIDDNFVEEETKIETKDTDPELEI